MRAFMSKPGDGPIYYDGDTLAYADGTTFAASYWERDSAEAIRLATFEAEREARAILEETERIDPTAGIYGETVALSTLRDGLKCLRGVPGKRYSIRTEEAQILAEALAAFVGDGQ